MDDYNQAQPPGLFQSLFGGLMGGGQQQGGGGLIGAIDPQKMAYLAMIAKGLDPYSKIDPEGMLKLAESSRQDALARMQRQQQIDISRGHLDVSQSSERRQQAEIDRKIAEAEEHRKAYREINTPGGSAGGVAAPPGGGAVPYLGNPLGGVPVASDPGAPGAEGQFGPTSDPGAPGAEGAYGATQAPGPTIPFAGGVAAPPGVPEFRAPAAAASAPDAVQARIQKIDKYLADYPDSKFSPMLEREREKLDAQNKLTRDYAQREAQADKMGLQGQSRDAFITGMAGLNKPALTAGDRSAIQKAEDALPEIQGTKEALQRALQLNPDVLTGYGAGLAGSLQARLALDPENKRKGEATVEWGTLMSREAIAQMSQSLKGATTDFELRKFENILADPSTPVEVRRRTIERMLTLAQRKEKTQTDRLNELRGGDYYKPGGGASKAPSQAAPESKPPVPNARQGKDGNWYVPNPAGGYYRVDQ